MKLTLKRIAKREKYTIGRLYADGKYIADTLEPSVDAPLHPAIPAGTYKVTLGIKSHKYSNFRKYPWAEKWGGMLPRLIAVPKREGILIHVGNTSADTQGCILVGENKIVGRVINSVAVMNDVLYPLLKGKREIEITVE